MEPLLQAIGALTSNLGPSVADPGVWRSLLVAVAVGTILFMVGRSVARRIGILAPDAPDGETLGIGLSTGLLLATAVWATVASGGRSAFTPIAIAFVIGILLTLQRPRTVPAADPPDPDGAARRRAPLARLSALCAIGFLVAVGLLFGATLAPSPRDGVQPVEFMDEAFYSILGRDIVASGTEAFYSPSGFGTPPGLPAQNWYHWGEIWLSGGVDMAFGVGPSFARHLVVLPLLLLASAMVIGSIARRAIGSSSRTVFVFGAMSGLLLAPIPIAGTDSFLTTWASGLLFSVTMYGLAAVEIPLLMLLILRGHGIPMRRAATVLFMAALVAIVLPSHVALALLGGAGAIAAVAILVVQLRLETGRMPRPSRTMLVVSASTAAMLGVTFAWGAMTGHGVIGGGHSLGISPFNHVWRAAIWATAAGSVVFLTLPVAWALDRRRRGLATMHLGVMAIVAGGALAWGARMNEFTMFHVFYGAIVVFATPMAGAAIVIVWARLRETGHGGAALLLIALAVLQVDLGIYSSGVRLVLFSARDYPPLPLEVMEAIRTLPPEAKIGYACRQREEIVYWDPRLLSIDLHTARRIVPLCYQVDFLAPYIGADGPADAVSPQFPTSPQFELFPTAEARPTPEEVMAFMKREGIGYLFVDEVHPNTLVPGAIPVLVSGDTQLLRLP